MKSKVFIFDANALISAALSPKSTNAGALKKALSIGIVRYSTLTWTEFLEVLFRKKFDKYFTVNARQEIADRFFIRFEEQKVSETIQVCRDPKDDKYLELAVAAKASCLISGDKDLLVLNPFRNIPILSATEFLNQF